MNQFKIWQIGLIYSVLIVGIIFAMPNFYPTKPAGEAVSADYTSDLDLHIIKVSTGLS